MRLFGRGKKISKENEVKIIEPKTNKLSIELTEK